MLNGSSSGLDPLNPAAWLLAPAGTAAGALPAVAPGGVPSFSVAGVPGVSLEAYYAIDNGQRFTAFPIVIPGV